MPCRRSNAARHSAASSLRPGQLDSCRCSAIRKFAGSYWAVGIHTPYEMGCRVPTKWEAALSKARIEANPVAGIILCCCGCLVDVYEQYFERLSANAYIEALWQCHLAVTPWWPDGDPLQLIVGSCIGYINQEMNEDINYKKDESLMTRSTRKLLR